MKTMELLLECLNAFAPFDTACGFDHCGLLVGNPKQQVQRVGIALDVTPVVLQEAKHAGCDVLLTHHPVIFHPLGTLSPESMPYQLVQAGMACVAMHTNLDQAAGGTNDVVAQKAGLTQVQSPAMMEELGRLGCLEQEQTVTDYVRLLKQQFAASMIRYYDAKRPVKRVVTVAGSGGDFLETAVLLGADTLVTGDLKHDRFVEAQVQGLNLIELNHFDAERTVLPVLERLVNDAGFTAVLLQGAAWQAQ